jgi:hypothetical protein
MKLTLWFLQEALLSQASLSEYNRFVVDIMMVVMYQNA